MEKPAPSLPRPSTVARNESRPRRTSALDEADQRPIHHVKRSYDYVRKDLLTISIVTLATLAFIVGMSFVPSWG
jgi:hypothetical protein